MQRNILNKNLNLFSDFSPSIIKNHIKANTNPDIPNTFKSKIYTNVLGINRPNNIKLKESDL